MVVTLVDGFAQSSLGYKVTGGLLGVVALRTQRHCTIGWAPEYWYEAHGAHGIQAHNTAEFQRRLDYCAKHVAIMERGWLL